VDRRLHLADHCPPRRPTFQCRLIGHHEDGVIDEQSRHGIPIAGQIGLLERVDNTLNRRHIRIGQRPGFLRCRLAARARRGKRHGYQ
jgi:hypothetical protein